MTLIIKYNENAEDWKRLLPPSVQRHWFAFLEHAMSESWVLEEDNRYTISYKESDNVVKLQSRNSNMLSFEIINAVEIGKLDWTGKKLEDYYNRVHVHQNGDCVQHFNSFETEKLVECFDFGLLLASENMYLIAYDLYQRYCWLENRLDNLEERFNER